jgi:hypothetical protein
MVGHDDAGHARGEVAQALPHARDLELVDTPSLESQRPRRVDADDGDLFVAVPGLEVLRDVTAVVRERAEEPRGDVVERDVVVSGDDELRLRKLRQVVARLPELPRPGALRQVARHHHEVRLQALRRRPQRLERRGVDPTEVEVGNVEDPSQGAAVSAGHGRTTRSDRGRTL